MTALVNENKLYSVIGKFFTDGSNLLFELIQNGQRAKATNINISAPYTGEHPFEGIVYSGNMLRIDDNGSGVNDIVALLGIATSDWDRDIDAQEPAGMGFLQLIALSKQVSIQSAFGHIIIDSKRFLSDPDYRQEVMESTHPEAAIKTGTIIIAEMDKPSFYYIRSDPNWYRGHMNLNLVLNDVTIEPLRITDLVKAAEAKKNIYTVLRYKGNSLFIEIGSTDALVSSYKSAVNWYGQIIPVSFSSGVASNYHIRFYYEVSKGTPLTPRYPDRTSLSYDDKYNEFMAYVNQRTLAMIRSYFDGFPKDIRFSAYTHYTLLNTYYEYATEPELETMRFVPITDDAFSGSGYCSDGIVNKRQMQDEGIAFHVGSIAIDDEYTLGADMANLRCYRVREAVAPYLRKALIREIVKIETTEKPHQLISLKPLYLRFYMGDGGNDTIYFEEALLMGTYNEAYIYAKNESAVHGVFDQYFEMVVGEDNDSCKEDVAQGIIADIDSNLTEGFNIVCSSHFHFLPRHNFIKSISFEQGNLAVAYDDGSTRDFVIRG